MPDYDVIVYTKDNNVSYSACGLPYYIGDLIENIDAPYKVCTFSRVIKEKGIEDAINAIVLLNKKYGIDKFHLDIYGEIDPSQTKWFDELKDKFPTYVCYKGKIDPSKSVSVLKNYYALLFPTYYQGEGFPGTILDAMASGLPVVASDWKYNGEIINHMNGVLFETQNIISLANALDCLHISRKNCLYEYTKYLPNNAIKTFLNNI